MPLPLPGLWTQTSRLPRPGLWSQASRLPRPGLWSQASRLPRLRLWSQTNRRRTPPSTSVGAAIHGAWLSLGRPRATEPVAHEVVGRVQAFVAVRGQNFDGRAAIEVASSDATPRSVGQERAIGARNGVRSIVVEHPLIELAGQIELPVVPCAELRGADWGNVGHPGTGRVAGRVIALVDGIVGRGPRVVVAPREHTLLASGRCGELEFVLAREKPAVPDAEGVRQRPVDAVYGKILVLAGVARPGRQLRIASEVAGGQAAVVRRVPSGLEQTRRAAVLESTATVKVRVLARPVLGRPLVAAVLAAERGDELTETADR